MLMMAGMIARTSSRIKSGGDQRDGGRGCPRACGQRGRGERRRGRRAQSGCDDLCRADDDD